MLSILCVRLTIKVKVGIPESFKVGWYPPKKTGSSHLKHLNFANQILTSGGNKQYQFKIFISLILTTAFGARENVYLK